MIKEFEEYLANCISSKSRVDEAMNYSLLARSKRIRPLLLLTLLNDCNTDYRRGFCAAAAIEMIHTYSLIHDDLPAFDNDDYRRGQLSCHKAFDEETAILAGDGLLTKSFELVADGPYSSQQKAEIISLMASYAGHEGMINGQLLDMQYETSKPTLEELITMDEFKTGKMITLPLLCGLIIADKNELAEAFKSIGRKLGIAFQIQDDLLDTESSVEQMGKSLSDERNNKTTYLTILGKQAARDKVNQLFDEIDELLPDNFKELRKLFKQIRTRNW